MKQQTNLKMTTDNRRPTAADFMLAELDDEKNRVRRLQIERARLFLAGNFQDWVVMILFCADKSGILSVEVPRFGVIEGLAFYGCRSG